MKNNLTIPYVISACLLCSALPLPTQAVTPAQNIALQAAVIRADEKIVLDGELNEAIWQRANKYGNFLEFQPKNGAPPSYQTSYQIAYDQQAIYVAIHAYDPRPEQIRAPFARHDTVTLEQDFTTVAIDAIGNQKVAQFFRINPAGATTDGLFLNDDTTDFSPDFQFSSAAKQVTDGYRIELRIPFSSLRYGIGANNRWRIMLVRNIPRDERVVLLNTSLLQSAASFIENMPEVAGITLPTDSHFLQLRPSITLRQLRDNSTSDSGTERSLGLGLDVKYRPSTSVVVDATLHPDFSQVDVDQPRLTRNVRFAFSTPEKRPFFMEGADLLQSPTNSIYTRTISAPLWGIRATLRDDEWNATAMTLRDKGQGSVLLPNSFSSGQAPQPNSQVSIAKVIRRYNNFDLSAFASQRDYFSRGDNIVLGTGISYRPTPEQRLRLQWSYSSTSALPDANNMLQKRTRLSGQEWFADFFMRTEQQESTLSINHTSANFRNDNGYVSQNDVLSLSTSHQRLWRNWGHINEAGLFVNLDAKKALQSNQLIERNLVLGGFATAGHGLEGRLEWHGYSATRPAENSALLRPQYWHGELVYSVGTWLPKIRIASDIGKLVDYDSRRLLRGHSTEVSATFMLFKRIELQPRLQRLTLKEQGKLAINENTWYMLGVYHLSQRDSLRLIAKSYGLDLQNANLQSTQRNKSQSLTYAHRGSDGSVFYLGWTRIHNHHESKSSEIFAKLQLNM